MQIFTSEFCDIALLLQQLSVSYSRTGRMEAKGCAKPIVWKESRRYFYWATRARLAYSNTLAQLAAASPSKSREYHEQFLYELTGVNGQSDHRIAVLKRENVVQQLLGDRKSLIDGLVRLVDHLSEDEKDTVLAALGNPNASQPSPGPSDSCTLLSYFTDNCIVL